jgi:hypothetical protein
MHLPTNKLRRDPVIKNTFHLAVLVASVLVASHGFASSERVADGGGQIGSATQSQRDATPSMKAARTAAIEAATDALGDVLDESSHIVLSAPFDNGEQLIFQASAEGCSVNIKVSKETGMAFNDDPMVCK